MGARMPAGGTGRWLALLASLLIALAVFRAQSAEVPCCAGDAPAGAVAEPATPVPAPAELLAATILVDPRTFEVELPRGVAPESGLQIRTIWAARAISVMFPEITTIGGFRQDPLKWHPNGLAIDVMIPDHAGRAGIELGNQIAGYALANAQRWGVLHVIWRQGFYPGVGAPNWTADYGSETANHFDHVHIATSGGGYPTGRESYFIGSMRTG